MTSNSKGLNWKTKSFLKMTQNKINNSVKNDDQI